MKYLDDYRNKDHIQTLVRAIQKETVHSWKIMEICGGQTHAIMRYGIEEMLPPAIQLLHGPGCPVCVTPEELIDRAIAIALKSNVVFTSFGDMMRVQGSSSYLLKTKAKGADIRILYSPLDALELAEKNPDQEIVFFAIGFETTIPVHLTALKEAERRGLKNFSLLCSFFAVPPAIEMIVSQPDNQIDGFLTAGHVCAVTGNEAYYHLSSQYRKPMVVTGFEPADLLYGIYKCIRQLEKGEAKVENAYARAVRECGNGEAKYLMEKYLEPVDREWRGIGCIPAGGFRLKEKYIAFDAEHKFPVSLRAKRSEDPQSHNAICHCGLDPQSPDYYKGIPRQTRDDNKDIHCIAGDIMKGQRQVADCLHFGSDCNPEHPMGAPMVSAEGVCAAYYEYLSFH